ncbi:CD209 antigen-like protein C [Xiphias gladius]|uniref:CD209 antigen-like protein C n=1 Tax=Xiphias gladius TaxID=8245 RepID=UPI001A984FD3|nr:CD209 antigen-like protein C [Xiphias gladius]
MEEIYVNVEYAKKPTKQEGLGSSKSRFHGAAVLFLGLLNLFLLAGIIGLVYHYYNSVQSVAADASAVRVNQTQRLQASDNKVSSLTEQRDRLNASLAEVTKELNKIQKKTCHAGWRMFGFACYHFSSESGPWEKGREACRNRKADLVVIDSPEEQMFLTNFTREDTLAWIGLTDRVKEGTWMWIDGAPLSLQYWRNAQPDNGGGQLGEEDCAHMRTVGNNLKNWNDLPCTTNLRWICEKRGYTIGV